MNRTQRILALLLGIQLVLSVVAFRPGAARTGGGGALLADLEAGDVVALTVTDDSGNVMQLRQVGGSWVLPEADDYPVRSDNVRSVLDKVLAVDSRRLVTRTSASHGRLQVAANGFLRKVDLEAASGTKHTLYLGSSPSYGATHVRLEGADETYLASNLTPWELSASVTSWAEVTYFSLPQDQLQTLTIQNAQGTLTFNRDGDGNWTLVQLPAGEVLSVAAVNTTVSRATSVLLSRPLGKENLPAYGMDRPLATVTLDRTDGQQVVLRIGAKDPTDNSYVVHASTSPFYVQVAEYYVKPLVENGLAEYLEVPATPTPQP